MEDRVRRRMELRHHHRRFLRFMEERDIQRGAIVAARQQQMIQRNQPPQPPQPQIPPLPIAAAAVVMPIDIDDDDDDDDDDDMIEVDEGVVDVVGEGDDNNNNNEPLAAAVRPVVAPRVVVRMIDLEEEEEDEMMFRFGAEMARAVDLGGAERVRQFPFIGRQRRVAARALMRHGPAAAAAMQQAQVGGVAQRGPQPAVAAASPAADVSPLLHDMIRQGCTCSSVLNGWDMTQEGCQRIVEQCHETAEQAFYVSPLTGRTPLHEACLRNTCKHIIKALMQANPMAALERDNASNTPLHLLFVDNPQHGYITAEDMNEIVDDLLTSSPVSVVTSANNSGATPLHMACTAPESMMHSSIFAKLLLVHPASAATRNTMAQTPLALYCKQRQADVEVARILVDADPSAITKLDQEGWSPLHDAAGNLNTSLMMYLLRCAPESARVRGRDSKSPLHVLCSHPQVRSEFHLTALQALLTTAPELVQIPESQNGRTPLHLACRHMRSSVPFVRLLLEANRDAVGQTDHDQYTALHHACESGASPEIVHLLLEMNSGSAAGVTRKQDTALHLACGRNASTESVRHLIRANRRALTMANDYGYTPLHCVTRAYQPKMGIVEALLSAHPAAVVMRTHGGETPMHLACSSGANVAVLQMLTMAQSRVAGKNEGQKKMAIQQQHASTNKIGNNPLHEACFRGASFEHIETLAKATPEWIVSRNNAGYTPIQIAAKGGHLDERIVTAFSRIRGPEVFSVVDSNFFTPLHSACREGTSEAAIQSLIRGFPDALHLRTTYGDTPLHLALLRNADLKVIEAIAESACERRHKALLTANTAGQTPIGLAMEAFQATCTRGEGRFCSVTSHYTQEQTRAFDTLAILVKLLYYGAYYKEESTRVSIVKACVCLHRRDVRLNPAFIRRAIHLNPDEVRLLEGEGFPLHVEASIPVEKMSLLDGPGRCACGGNCHSRAGVLGTLLSAYPEATQVRNDADEFPLGLMIRNGRPWDHTFGVALRNFPPALHWYKGMDDKFTPTILAKVSKECGSETLFSLLRSRPDMLCAGDGGTHRFERYA